MSKTDNVRGYDDKKTINLKITYYDKTSINTYFIKKNNIGG